MTILHIEHAPRARTDLAINVPPIFALPTSTTNKYTTTKALTCHLHPWQFASVCRPFNIEPFTDPRLPTLRAPTAPSLDKEDHPPIPIYRARKILDKLSKRHGRQQCGRHSCPRGRWSGEISGDNVAHTVPLRGGV